MKSLLVGNGLIIEYGGNDYINKNIIARTIKNAKIGKYEDGMKKTLPPKEAHSFFELFAKEICSTIKGDYDKYAYFETEKAALYDFKERYPTDKIDINNVGFEDYFLVLRLIFNRFKETAETRIGATTAMKRLFIDSIYNDGKINNVYTKFPLALRDYICNFNKIFTTNYDKNLELATNKYIYHLHGQFDVLEDVYDENSLRNQLSDKPAEKINFDEKYKHTYSNIIMDFTKESIFNMPAHANNALDKFASSINTNEQFDNEIASWKNDKNPVLRNAHEAIMLKAKNSDLKMNEYPARDFTEISDSITIIGFSPSNDTHLYKLINSNKKLDSVIYYYFSDEEKIALPRILPDKDVKYLPVKELWESFY